MFTQQWCTLAFPLLPRFSTAMLREVIDHGPTKRQRRDPLLNREWVTETPAMTASMLDDPYPKDSYDEQRLGER